MTDSDANRERTVKCPICGEEKLARGIYLHVNRSVGNGHGEQGEIPEGVNLENLESAGEQEVSMDYPETRITEQVRRRCPYCEDDFSGKQGVMIHLGRMAGKGVHPEDGRESVDPDDLSIVHVDEHGNVVQEVEEGTLLPSTEKRLERESKAALEDRVRQVIKEFRREGKDEAADRVREALDGS